MAERESLADKAVRVVAAVTALKVTLQGVNDYGDATGYCQEHEQIWNDLDAQLGMLGARAYRLQRRYERAQMDKEQAERWEPPP